MIIMTKIHDQILSSNMSARGNAHSVAVAPPLLISNPCEEDEPKWLRYAPAIQQGYILGYRVCTKIQTHPNLQWLLCNVCVTHPCKSEIKLPLEASHITG